MQNTDTNSVFSGQYWYAAEYICPLRGLQGSSFPIHLRLPHYMTLDQVTYQPESRLPEKYLILKEPQQSPIYAMRVQSAFVFTVTQSDSLPFCLHLRGCYGTARLLWSPTSAPLP